MQIVIDKRLGSLEKLIGYTFADSSLLERAITHSSYANEHRGAKGDYERLEFIGDAILEMVSSLKLYRDLPDEGEGRLSKIRAGLVCEESLSQVALEKLKLDTFIRLGRGEETSGGCKKPSILCDVVEAIIGAIYLDGGYDRAAGFIEAVVLPDIAAPEPIRDNKTALQEYVQSHSREAIEYRLIDETGPDHKKEFTVIAVVGGRETGRGVGSSKKQAQQNAAGDAMRRLGV